MRLVSFLVANFGPIGVFYFFNYLWGLKAAVIATVVWSVGEIVLYRIQKKPITPFFLFSAGVAILFGLIDIFLQKSVLFKYEGAMSNVLFGFYFGASLFTKKTIIQGFAEAQGRITQAVSPDTEFLFRFLTGAWVLYFFVKASAYAWIAANYSIGESLAIRGTAGNISFYAMLFVSIAGAKRIRDILGQFKLLPSTRK